MPTSTAPPERDAWFDLEDYAPPPSEPEIHDDEEPTPRPPRRTSTKAKIAGIIGAAAIGIGSIAGISIASSKLSSSTDTAAAATGAPGGQGMQGAPGAGGPGGGGTITAINGSSITLSSMDGSTSTITASASTTVTKSVAGSLSDLKVGDNVVVMGTSADDGTVTAQRIMDSGTIADTGGPGANGQAPPNGNANANANGGGGNAGTMNMSFSRGTISAVDGSSITVTASDGTATKIATSSSTSVSTVQSSSLSALAVGDQVRVRGTTGSDGSTTAERIETGDIGGPQGAQQGAAPANGSTSGNP